MTLRIALFAAAFLLGVSSAAQAQSAAPEDAQAAPRGFSLGVGAIASEGPLLGEDSRTLVIPIVGYEGERIFFRGISGGVHLFQRGGFELDALVAARLDGWDARDLGAAELAGVGIDRALLRDRDNGVDMGLGMAWEGAAGKLGAEAKADVSNASDGYELKLDYEFPVPAGAGTLIPGAGVSYWSDRLSDYYYGTLQEEEARGVARYRPGAVLVPQVSLGYARPLTQRWLMLAAVEYRWLPSELTDSPLVEGDGGLPSVFIGFSRTFGATR